MRNVNKHTSVVGTSLSYFGMKDHTRFSNTEWQKKQRKNHKAGRGTSERAEVPILLNCASTCTFPTISVSFGLTMTCIRAAIYECLMWWVSMACTQESPPCGCIHRLFTSSSFYLALNLGAFLPQKICIPLLVMKPIRANWYCFSIYKMFNLEQLLIIMLLGWGERK